MSSLRDKGTAVSPAEDGRCDGLHYSKRSDHSTGEGDRYEERLLALVLLRCLRRGLRFQLSANNADAGNFDDLVLVWHPEHHREARTMLVQLTHKKDKVLHAATFLGESHENKFSLLKYSTSYQKIGSSLKTDGHTLVLMTNAPLADSRDGMFVSQNVADIPGMELLQTGGGLYKLNADDERVRKAVRGDSSFVNCFYLLCEQRNSEEIAVDIYRELEEFLGASKLYGDSLCNSIREWMNTESVCLTSGWSKWQALVDKYVRKEVTGCRAPTTRLRYNSVEDIRKHLMSRNPAWVRPPGQGATALTAIKVQQALGDETHILVGAERFRLLRDRIISCWGPFCRWLVLVEDAELSYDTLVHMAQLAGPNRRLVIVSYKSDDSFQDTCKSGDIDDDSWNSLINVTVNLNSEHQSCCLKDYLKEDLCDTEAEAEAKAQEHLKAMLDGKPEPLVFLSQLSGPLRLGQDLDPPPKKNISRELTSQMRIREEFFSTLGEKEVCIMDEKSYKLLKSQSVLKNTARFEELEKCLSDSDAGWPRIVVTDISDLSKVQSICRKYPNLIKYVLSYASDGWEILFFHGDSKKIRPHIEEQSKNLLQVVNGLSNRVIIEGKPGMGKSTILLDMASQLSKRVIIEGKQGMGKSTILPNMASQLEDQHTLWWILRINLFKYSELFVGCGSGVEASNYILAQAVHNKGNLGILERTLLEYCLRKHRHIICLVDGFDEVCPDYADICLQTLQELAPHRGKLLVTTRPSVTGHLEEALGVVAHSLPPFSEDQLYSYHGWHGSEIGVTEVVRDLLKIPLFSYMYAETLEGQMRIDDIPSLYEAFFENEVIRMCKKRGDNLFAAGKKKILEAEREEHEKRLQFLALSHLFPRLEAPSSLQSLSIDKNALLRTGVISEFIQDKPVFIHRTYAEYFVAKWCFSNIADKMCAKVYCKAFSDSSLEFLVESFDTMVSRGRLLLTAVLKGSESEVKSLLEKGADPAERDKVGRNCLHVAPAYSRDPKLLSLLWDHLDAVGARGSEEVTRQAGVDYRVGEVARTEGPERRAGVSEFVEASGSAEALAVERARGTDPLQPMEALDAALGVEDGLLHWTPLRYAAECRHWWAVAALLDMGAQLDHLGDFRRDVYKPEELWNIFKEKRYSGLLQHIRHKSRSLRSLLFEDNRNVQIEVGVTIVCVFAELPVSKYEEIMNEARENKHFEVGRLIERKMADNIKKSTVGSLSWKFRQLDDYKRWLTHQSRLGKKTDQELAVVNMLLRYAAATGNTEILQQVIATGGDINAKDRDGISALHTAAHVGNVGGLKWLLNEGADINITNIDGETPLMMAAGAGQVQCVKILLEHGADANVQNLEGSNVLHRAVDNWNAKCVRLLVRKVKNLLESTDEVGRTALFLAARAGNAESVKHLLQAGARVSSVTNDRETPLHAAAFGGNAECVRQLVQAKADVGAKNKDGLNALHYAAYRGNTECVGQLLEFGASVTERDKVDRTPLHFAADSGSANSTRCLLEKGAGVGDRDEDRNTALHCAAAAGSVEVVQLLIRAGADVDARNKQGLTPLHGAADSGHGRSDGPGSDAQKLRDYGGCARELLKSGADVDARTTSGDTALHFAVLSGNAECVGVLLEAKADPVVQNSRGLTPIHYAMARKNDSVIRLLLDAGAHVLV